MTLAVPSIEGDVSADAGGPVLIGTLAPTGGTPAYRFIAVGQAFHGSAGALPVAMQAAGSADIQAAGAQVSASGRVSATSSITGAAGRRRAAAGRVAAAASAEASAGRRRAASSGADGTSAVRGTAGRRRRAAGSASGLADLHGSAAVIPGAGPSEPLDPDFSLAAVWRGPVALPAAWRAAIPIKGVFR